MMCNDFLLAGSQQCVVPQKSDMKAQGKAKAHENKAESARKKANDLDLRWLKRFSSMPSVFHYQTFSILPSQQCPS